MQFKLKIENTNGLNSKQLNLIHCIFPTQIIPLRQVGRTVQRQLPHVRRVPLEQTDMEPENNFKWKQ